MGFHIAKTEAAAKAILKTDGNPGGTLYLTGDPGATEVPLEQSIVNGGEEDVNNDDHWMPIVIDGTAITLSATNTMIAVPFRAPIRINKPASSGNEYGVRYR